MLTNEILKYCSVIYFKSYIYLLNKLLVFRIFNDLINVLKIALPLLLLFKIQSLKNFVMKKLFSLL